MIKAKKLSNVLSLDDLAELLGITTFEALREFNEDYLAESWVEGYQYALQEGESEEDAEEQGVVAKQKAEAELYHSWEQALTYVASKLFAKHGLELEDEEGWERKVVPIESWKDAARQIMNTINGATTYEFSTVADFLKSGPYTPKEAVLRHLHWIRQYPDIHGGGSAARLFEQRFR